MRNQIKGKLSISRNSNDIINIRLDDVNSKTEFVSVDVTPEDFAYALTGLARQDVSITVRDLELVGKRRIVESRQATTTLKSYKIDDYVKWLEENCQEDGWILDTYLGSQNSIVYKNDSVIINYTVVRYEE